MRHGRFGFCTLRFCFSPSLTLGQHEYFSNWFARVDKTERRAAALGNAPGHDNSPPGGGIPLRSTLADESQRSCHRHLRWRKGLELIPLEKVEVILMCLPISRTTILEVPDGFGDVAFLVEYRVLSANEEQGSYILTAFLGWSLRSGQYPNGALHAGHYGDNCVRQRVRRFRCPRQVRSRSSCRLYFHHLLHRGLRVELQAYHGLLLSPPGKRTSHVLSRPDISSATDNVAGAHLSSGRGAC